ncbi:PDR/VanB family oxidoreductase [Streptomyces sp. NBC_01275]|uniref:PDR/VanB family oxidoreductase n=1 Tax=Streptomyces sp. NBC_01275 TaxID=2903807 RepID=UPI002251E26D|nr:PDR/VanB family oxidoreductase [Streptomyces sp. NBC_01275]MCX4761542.1 PDR/VanB family oxidoreductase [Streptomyces sp. NBC_01275]
MSGASQEPFDLLVHRMTWEATDVLSVDLVHPQGKPLPAWTPGAHIDLHLDGLVRQYSLCGDPADPARYRVAVLNDPASRGGSAYVHRALRPGASVTVRGPRNHFELADAGAYVFVAGGIGVTPLLTQAREAGERGRPWEFWYAGRSRASMAFGEELGQLAAADRTVTLHPKDEHGRLDLDRVLTRVPADALVYCCGPERLTSAVRAGCAALGLLDRLRVEHFAAAPADGNGADGEGAGEERAFEVECVRSGVTVTVGPDEAIVDALENVGVLVDASCRDGVCGTCEVPVLEGELDHRDMVLSDAERAAGDTVLVCVSRCRSQRLVLDL